VHRRRIALADHPVAWPTVDRRGEGGAMAAGTGELVRRDDDVAWHLRRVGEILVQGQRQTNIRFRAVETRLDRVEARLDAVETRLDRVEARLDAVEARLDRVEEKLDALIKEVDQIKRTLNRITASMETLTAYIMRDELKRS